MSRKSLKCNHARKLNGNLMPYVNQKWASRVLNMEINAGKGPDLLGTRKFAEVKFSLINPKENEKTNYQKSWTVQEHQIEYNDLWTVFGFWAMGLYELNYPYELIEITGAEDKEEREKRLEEKVIARELYIINWSWIYQYSPSKVKYGNIFRYPKLKDIPAVRESYDVDKGIVHLTKGVPGFLWADIQGLNQNSKLVY